MSKNRDRQRENRRLKMERNQEKNAGKNAEGYADPTSGEAIRKTIAPKQKSEFYGVQKKGEIMNEISNRYFLEQYCQQCRRFSDCDGAKWIDEAAREDRNDQVVLKCFGYEYSDKERGEKSQG